MSGYAPPISHATVATDEVIPLCSMDIYRYATAFSGAYKWCINGTLDVQVLKLGLDELIARGEWRKLGARIRRNAEGRLEWHVPRQFSKARPAYHMTISTYASMEAAKLYIPGATSVPSIQPNLGPDSVFVHPSTPITLEEYLDPEHDHPCFNIHVSLFLDGSVTCTGITIPHVLGDGTGISKMLMNWLTLMGNPNAAVPAMHSYDKDPFAPLESAYEFAEDLTTETWEEILHNIHLQEEREDHPREVRTVYLPGSLVSRMRAEAVEELAQRRKRGEDVPDFLSENDILSAWWIKILCTDVDPDDKTPLISFVGSSLRKQLPEYFPRDTWYPHNATLAFASESVPIGAVRNMTICDIALLSRWALVRGLADKQALKRAVALKLWSKALTANNATSFTSPSSAFGAWHFTSAWTEARCMDWDFSPAVALSPVPGTETRRAKPGSVRAFSGGVYQYGPYPVRALLTVLAKDKDGGYWLQPYMRKAYWNAGLEDRLRRFGWSAKL
ncbi:hypothetical protein GLOTRDRAFT_93712 [Gloeophyllum trabeum ATCC 11539]|uniref:Uncharacterized protein n=1 Tax=Gloeophyllum trabeum (strain ATCC 11539 / FP-39264 / Madison 617) TaxID=670483 RepID=S7RQL4_GLOTA|nr:uncharacterized protein GLOTRDRAFT_93712 [Gloeophyllum trabeum ATCC 11539]EPQ55194.1 hypothetical protein GLOTRDRAFT_93712 [Gloeophyllum trabeum ATCC 11539]